MKRNIDINEVSDGKLYTANDMARLGCNGCTGCSDCCSGMGDTIVLDPYDAYCLMKGLNMTFDELLADKVEINMFDGVILPNLKMAGESETCGFLDQNGRCTIHAIRPGVCRLFPLGRIYEDGGFRYFLQIYECKKQKRSKEKISKWIGVPEIKKYERFISDWHYFLLDMEEEIKQMKDKDKICRTGLNLLAVFYRKPYDTKLDFYSQFYERLNKVRNG